MARKRKSSDDASERNRKRNGREPPAARSAPTEESYQNASRHHGQDLDHDRDRDRRQANGEMKPVQRNAANARERARMRVLSKAFSRLKTTLPWVPADTKLSKLDTLRLAASYIAHLRHILLDKDDDDDDNDDDDNVIGGDHHHHRNNRHHHPHQHYRHLIHPINLKNK